MSKLPAIQFYPGDWRKDVGVQSLTFHDRGVWFEMLMLMHESPVRGKLMIGGKAASDELISSVLHIDLETFRGTVTTLLDRGICDRDSRTGALMNRRMVRDEQDRSKNRKKLNDWRNKNKTNGNGNQHETGDVTEKKPLPSSSSSSSSSSSDVRASAAPTVPAPELGTDDDEEEANIPDDLPAPVMGNYILQRLSIPHSPGLSLKFADCVDLLARDEGYPRGEAARLLIHRGRDHPPDNGKWRFWLEDGSWQERIAQGISTEGWE